MSDTILITGGAGFIGYFLAKKLLKKGYRVDLLDNFSRGVRDSDLQELEENEGLRCLEVDLLDYDSVIALEKNYVAIFHLAAIIGVRHVLNRPYEVLVHNVRMLDHVISLAKRQKDHTRLFFASTSEVYAGTLASGQLPIPTPEVAPLIVSALDQPRSAYMLSKIYGEMMCQNSRIPFTIFRPHNVYGPRMGMAHVIPEQLGRIWEASSGDRIKVRSADHRRSFCYIDDAVEMLFRMLRAPSCVDRTLNLGVQDPEIAISELVKKCIETVGKELHIDEADPDSGSPVRRAPEMTVTTELLNYEPRIDLMSGLATTWEWYRKKVFTGSNISAL